MAALTSISQPATGKGAEQLQMNPRKTQVTGGQAKVKVIDSDRDAHSCLCSHQKVI